MDTTSFNLNVNIDFNKTGVSLKRCDHTHVTVKYDIQISCLPVFWKIYSFSVNLVRRRISEAQRWQIIGMQSTGISFKAIECQMSYHYTVVRRLGRKHTQTNTERLAKTRKTTCNIAAWRQGTALLGQTDTIHN